MQKFQPSSYHQDISPGVFQVQKVKDKAQGVADVISADKAIAESKLEAAKPALKAAEEALQVCDCKLCPFPIY